MQICDICKKEKEHLNKGKGIDICDSCLLDIVSAFTYYIDGKEVTKNEFDRQVKNEDS